MDIIKQSSSNSRIHFFRNTAQPDWFFVKEFSDKKAATFYLCSRHLPPHEDSGYEDLPIEWAFALEFGNANSDRFINFIREEKGIKHGDESDRRVRWIGVNGWYEFTDIKNTDKWLNDFYDFQKQRQKELQKSNVDAIQTTLF